MTEASRQAAPEDPGRPSEAEEVSPRGALGLNQTTALIVGSIIGVGIFNLPGSLAAYGPISLLAMALTTVGALALAVMFASLTRRASCVITRFPLCRPRELVRPDGCQPAPPRLSQGA